jgi:hypothetical protein
MTARDYENMAACTMKHLFHKETGAEDYCFTPESGIVNCAPFVGRVNN